MRGRRGWAIPAGVATVAVLMTLAVACSSNDNKGGNATATEVVNDTPSETIAQTPSETVADQTPGGTPTAGAVAISEQEFSITGPDGAAIESPPAGSVTFEVHNNGTMDHVFYVFKTDTDAASLPLSGNEVDEAKAGTDVGEIDGVAAGSIKTLTIDLQPGKYVLICNRPGHYQQGMHAAFVVQ